MKKVFLSLLAPLALLSPAAEAPPFLPDDGGVKWRLTQYATWTREPDGKTGLEINIPADASIRNQTYGAHAELDLSRYRGKQIVISAEMSAEGVPAQKQGFRSVKLLLFCRDAAGKRYQSSSQALWGTFDYRPQSLVIAVPEGGGEYTLMVGVQNNTGKVRVRNLHLEEKDPYPAPVPLPAGFRCEYSEAFRNAPRLRGAGCTSETTVQDLRDFAALGGNMLRWWLKYDSTNNDQAELEKNVARLESLLPECEKLGIRVIPILTGVPGNRFSKPRRLGITDEKDDAATKGSGNFRLFFDKELLKIYVEFWKKTAVRFRNQPAIYGYSVMNEPTQFGTVPYDYLYCQYLAAKAIREIDPERAIYIAANDWDKADAFPYLKPLPLKNIVYEVHMYTPHPYTHQGVGESIKNIRAGKYLTYPGVVEGTEYNREVLRKSLQPVVDFQKKYGALVYCGEFSVIRWAPGGTQYLDDLCSIFEEFGWDWAYHCYREWMNWSLEYTDSFADNTPAQSETGRMKVIRGYWRKNQQGN